MKSASWSESFQAHNRCLDWRSTMSYAELAYPFEESPLGNFAVDEVPGAERGFVQGPIRGLMSALLFDGVISCMNYAGIEGKNGRAKFREALNWITTPGDEYVFSFDNVCQCLGIDPSALRAGITRICSLRRAGTKKSRRTF